MKIVLNEMKKIFSFKRTIILIVLNFLIYGLFIHYGLANMYSSRGYYLQHNMITDFIKKNGSELDAENYKKLEQLYDEKQKNLQENEKDVDANEEYSCIAFDIKMYKEGMSSDYPDDIDRAERVKEIQRNKENLSILPFQSVWGYVNALDHFSVCAIICIVVLLLPAFIKSGRQSDKSSVKSKWHIDELSKETLAAGLLASFIITTIQTILFFIEFCRNGDYIFFNSNINSSINGACWFSLNFRQYIIIMILMMYVISMVTAVLTMVISSKVPNLTVGILIMINIVIAFMFLIKNILIDDLFILPEPKYTAIEIYIGMIAVAVLLAVLSCKRGNRIKKA